MAGLLTRGAIAEIIEGRQPERPMLQVLSMKKIPSGEQERYRLLVSDGQWSSSFAMLATQLNEMVSSGQVSNNCIFKMNRYICNTVQESKKILIILDLDVVKSGEEIGGKVGEPVNYDPAKNKGGASRPAPTEQRERTLPPSVTGGNVQRNPLAQRNPPNIGASPARTPTGGSVHPIASLTPYQNRWTICVRVTNKSAIRTWSNSRGEGKLFSMDLLDESGEIRATAFNEQLDKFYDMLESWKAPYPVPFLVAPKTMPEGLIIARFPYRVRRSLKLLVYAPDLGLVAMLKEQGKLKYISINKVYFITGGTLKTANKQYSNLNNDYELTLNKMSEISPCHEDTAIPTMQYSFVPLNQLDQVTKDSVVDVIGVCKEAMELSTITQRTTGRELKKRDLQIIDDSKHEVRVTLWGTSAENFDGSLQPVLAIKGAKVSDFNGVSLSLLSSSSYQVNPDITEAHKLKGWFDNGGCSADTVNLSNQRSGGPAGGMGNVYKTFGEAKVENLGGRQGDQADYYSVKASLVLIRKENCLYPACPSANCNKKVVDLNNGMYRCEKCNQEYDNFEWRLMVSANLADISDNQWVTMFQDQAEAVLGVSAQELGGMRDNNNEAFQNVFADATFKSFNFRMRVKMETYNDESRLKNTVAQCTPIVPKEYNRRLISEIKQMAGQA